ncbi:hypothetical protein AVM71_15455 [Piscirickettsia salmonis]|nr:hypothetical protein AVM71_15455 [Piscirickettsia salmonis]
MILVNNKDPRHPEKKRSLIEHAFGLPGTILGLVPAAIGAATVLAGRTFANSVRSAALVTGTAIKKVLHQDQEDAIQPVIDFGNNKDPRHPEKKRSLIEHAFGLPGTILGLVPAAIGAATVLAGRTFANSVRSAALVTGTAIKKVLHQDQEDAIQPVIDFGNNKDPRHPEKKRRPDRTTPSASPAQSLVLYPPQSAPLPSWPDEPLSTVSAPLR